MEAICVIHWDEEKGAGLRSEVESLGYAVTDLHPDPTTLLKTLKADPPLAVVIDLSRSPALGRDVGVALRMAKATRRVPLIFLGGKPEKVGRVREILPDAVFTDEASLGPSLEASLANPPSDPVVPSSGLAGYSGTPLPKKLGIKEGSKVLLARPPEGFPETLGPLPDGVVLARRFGPGVDLILWFVRDGAELDEQIELWASRTKKGGIWILWAKKGSERHSGVNQAMVRGVGLANGLVDYKIASIDSTWSGLKFACRKR